MLAAWYVDFAYLPLKPVVPDETRFLDAARHLAATGEYLVQDMHAREMPLIAAFYALLGSDLLVIRFVQAFTVPIQAMLMAGLGRRLFGPRAGLLAGCVAALYPFFLFYQALALSETLFTVLMLAFVAFIYRRADDGRSQVPTMGLAALATYAKASLTFLPPFLLIPLARPRTVIVALLIYLVCLAPWWARNYALLDAFVPFSTTASMNLYVGNNPKTVTGRGDWNVDADQAEVDRLMAIPNEVERSKAFTKASFDFIEANPGRFVQLCLIRLGGFWNVIPNASAYRGGLFPWIAAVSTGPVMLFALIGAWLTRRQWRRLAPIYLLIGYFTALHTVTIASLRYRFPIEPYLILIACAGAVSCYDWLRKRPWRPTSIST